MALAAFAVAASSIRLVAVPGVEFYLGPLFYLMAYRVGGLKLGLAFAATVMLPTLFWWGHPYSIIIALCHVLFVFALRNRIASLLQSTALFYLTLGGVLNVLILWHLHNPPLVVGILTFARKLLNDLMLAGAVDLICAFVKLEVLPLRLQRRRTFSLRLLMLAGTPLSLIGAMTAMFVSDVRQFAPIFASYRVATELHGKVRWLEGARSGRPPDGFVSQTASDGLPDLLWFSASPIAGRESVIKSALHCSLIDDGSPVVGADDRNTFAFWLKACQARRIDVPGQSFYLIYSTRAVAERAYADVLAKLMELVPVMAIAFGLQLFMLQSMDRSLRAWRKLMARFGQPDLVAPTSITLQEFVRPVAAFVQSNNDYVRAVTERRRLADALTDLSSGIDLRLLSDVRFNAATGRLSFLQIDLTTGSTRMEFVVHPGDRLTLETAENNDQSVAELRIHGADSNDWHLLMTRGLLGTGHWQSGCIIRLHQPKVTQNRMLHQARLIELGGMASALSHEMKQPLFTIALAAENGSYQLADDDRPAASKARAKFERITEQVERARTIIGRISRYARVESADELFDLIDGVRATTVFMRPLLIQEDIQVEVIDEMDGDVSVCMPRVGLEQIIVNAIQNAVDSIVTRRQAAGGNHAGKITVRCSRTTVGVTMEISDNGTGLGDVSPDKLFEAFVTTKAVEKGTGLGLYISRQIMMEAGGAIALASRPGPEGGAVMTISFNEMIPANARMEAACQDQGC